MAEIADITPTATDATDRFLVRRGTTSKSLELLSGLTPSELDDLIAEVVAARGAEANLDARLDLLATDADLGTLETEVTTARGVHSALKDSIQRHASAFPRPVIAVAGLWLDIVYVGGSGTTIVATLDSLRVFPFVPARDVTVDQIAMRVTAGATSAVGRTVIYDSDGDGGRPGTRLFEGASKDMSAATSTPTDNLPADFVLRGGKNYWIGNHFGVAAPTMRGWSSGAAPILGKEAAADSHWICGYALSRPYGDGTPATWGSTFTGLASNSSFPSILLRRA